MDNMTNFNTAQGVAKVLEKVFPQGGARAAIGASRMESYKADNPAGLLRAMADMIDPPKKPKRKKTKKKK